jgi:ribosomal protein L37E
VSGQVGQAYAYSHGSHGSHGGHWSGGRWGGGGGYSSWYWYYPYYSSYYPYCNYGYYYTSVCNSSYYNSAYYYGQPAQYQLTVTTNPSSVSSQATGGGSYNSGTSASFSTQNVIQASKDTRYVFKGWSGDYSGASASASITMDSSKTVTAMYQTQYLLSMSAQPSNAPSPQGGGWYNAGDTAPLSASAQTVGGGDGTRLVFTGWSVDGDNPGSTAGVQMNTPHTITAVYKQQYHLTVNSDQGTPSGAGWYDAGTNAPISVSTPSSPSYGVSLVFNGWQGSGVQSSSQSTQVMMDGAKTVTATWRTDATLLYATIAVVLIAILLIAGAGFYSMTQRRRGTNGTEFCSRCGRPFRPSNIYCVSCGTPRASAAGNPETPQPPRGNDSTRHV